MSKRVRLIIVSILAALAAALVAGVATTGPVSVMASDNWDY